MVSLLSTVGRSWGIKQTLGFYWRRHADGFVALQPACVPNYNLLHSHNPMMEAAITAERVAAAAAQMASAQARTPKMRTRRRRRILALDPLSLPPFAPGSGMRMHHTHPTKLCRLCPASTSTIFTPSLTNSRSAAIRFAAATTSSSSSSNSSSSNSNTTTTFLSTRMNIYPSSSNSSNNSRTTTRQVHITSHQQHP